MVWKAKKRFLVYMAIIISLLVILCITYPIRILEVTNLTKRRLIFSAPISLGESFTISFIHSVDKTPVRDIYVVQRDNTLKIHESYFRLQCCGAPFKADEGTLTMEGGWLVMRNITRPAMSTLVIAVASINNFTISLRDESVPLAPLTENGDIVEVKIVVKPVIRSIFP